MSWKQLLIVGWILTFGLVEAIIILDVIIRHQREWPTLIIAIPSCVAFIGYGIAYLRFYRRIAR